MSEGALVPTRDALQVAALRGAVAALLVTLHAASRCVRGTTDLDPEVPREAVGLGLLPVALAMGWLRVRPRSRRLSAVVLGAALGLGALLAHVYAHLRQVATRDQVSVALMVAAGAGVVVAALALVERAALLRAVRLRARAAAALAVGLGAALGCAAVKLQVDFARKAGDSFEAGLREALGWARADLDGGEHVRVLLPLALGVGVVAWARLCHRALWRQAIPVVALSWLGALVVFAWDDHPFEPWRRQWLWRSLAPTLGLLLLLRGLERLEARALRIEPLRPRPQPPGSPRRLAAALLGLALALAAAHLGLTWHFAGRLAEKLAELRARGEPLSLADQGPVPPEEDAAGPYARACAAFVRAGPPPARRDDPAQVEAWLARNATTLQHLAEAARRPRWRPREQPGLAPWHLSDLLSVAWTAALRRGDTDAALATLEVYLGLLEALEPEAAGWHEGFHRDLLPGVRDLVVQGEPSAAACRRLLAWLRRPPPGDFVLRALRGERMRLLRARHEPRPGRLAARLGWVRDRDLRLALEHVDRVIADWLARRVKPEWEPHPEVVWTPLLAAAKHAWPWATLERDEERRALASALLALRLHRLETGAYPATLDALREPVALPPEVGYSIDGTGGCTLTGWAGKHAPPVRLR